MDTDPNKDNTKVFSTSDVLSVICFVFTAYCILKLFQPSQDAPIPEISPGQPHVGTQEVLRTTEVGNDEQVEDLEIGSESPEEEKYGMRRHDWDKSFGVEGGRTDIISLSESEESGAGGLLGEEDEDEDGDGDGDGDGENDLEEAEAKPRSSKERGRIHTAYTAPENPASPKKQSEVKQARKPTTAQRVYNDDHYDLYDSDHAIYDPSIPTPGRAVRSSFRHFRQYDEYELYINPDLKETELDKVPHFGVRVDDLTASKLLPHFDRKTLIKRWPADFDRRGMIRNTRVPLGRAAKRWVKSGEKDVDGERVAKEGWYYLSWGGIHTLMGKEGLDADRYYMRPSFESFKCPGLGFKISDWAEIQLAPEDPADPTFL